MQGQICQVACGRSVPWNELWHAIRHSMWTITRHGVDLKSLPELVNARNRSLVLAFVHGAEPK